MKPLGQPLVDGPGEAKGCASPAAGTVDYRPDLTLFVTFAYPYAGKEKRMNLTNGKFLPRSELDAQRVHSMPEIGRLFQERWGLAGIPLFHDTQYRGLHTHNFCGAFI
ncbi:hypothetical protein RRH01S_15_00050 [Rhizobium rhizogenes NBRC 13257]|uniref:Uncharacterized protein n=1 Tax=Rhizobium rhizogenes NBRC 13257 TaxID=1220581 RepID=A0AA87U788_RHIRH|nr:hypothetical protein RRH01S_15_00050 [Rhizobium rhizogenes NBRC 13257]